MKKLTLICFLTLYIEDNLIFHNVKVFGHPMVHTDNDLEQQMDSWKCSLVLILTWCLVFMHGVCNAMCGYLSMVVTEVDQNYFWVKVPLQMPYKVWSTFLNDRILSRDNRLLNRNYHREVCVKMWMFYPCCISEDAKPLSWIYLTFLWT